MHRRGLRGRRDHQGALRQARGRRDLHRRGVQDGGKEQRAMHAARRVRQKATNASIRSLSGKLRIEHIAKTLTPATMAPCTQRVCDVPLMPASQ